MSFSIYLTIILIFNTVFSERITLNTNIGQIIGVKSDKSTKYLGIPYGVVNEDNPFWPAKPQPSFNKPYDATNIPPICPQYIANAVKGNINCLNLNIYTPTGINLNKKIPVMIYLHGGKFAFGDGNTYIPDFLVKHEIIVVLVNYRLGPYGFLCFENSKYSNVGLQDQNLALHWVKNNINSFGGDENNIILIGHSAGAISTDLHLLYNNNGLFNKVIIQSGVAISPVVLGKVNKDMNKITTKFNFTGNSNNVDEVIEFLKRIKVNDIIENTKNEPFRPCIDGLFVKSTPNVANLKDIKMIIGNTNNDAFTFYLEEQFDLKNDLLLSFTNVTEKMAGLVHDFYFNGDFHDDLKEYGTDYVFNYPLEKSVRLYLKNGAVVYRYLFSYSGKRNIMKISEKFYGSGAYHADELGYLFDMDTLDKNITLKDRQLIDRMTILWTNFAKYGDPTPGNGPLKWEPQRLNTRPYLHLDSSTSLQYKPYQRRMVFWDMYHQLFDRYLTGFDYGDRNDNCD